jgi:hypothetical protein
MQFLLHLPHKNMKNVKIFADVKKLFFSQNFPKKLLKLKKTLKTSGFSDSASFPLRCEISQISG